MECSKLEKGELKNRKKIRRRMVKVRDDKENKSAREDEKQTRKAKQDKYKRKDKAREYKKKNICTMQEEDNRKK